MKKIEFKKGDVVNGYRFVKEYPKFNLWEHITYDINGQIIPLWKTCFGKDEKPAAFVGDYYKEGDRVLE